MACLSISLLGPFQASLDNQLINGFETTKSRALLAYLAEEAGRPWTRSMLAGLLWPERPEDAALNNLRHTLANLRQVIRDGEATPAYLAILRGTIAFNLASDSTIDTHDFIQLADNRHAHPDLRVLERVVALYHGDFLEGMAVGDCPALEEWILARREQYRSRMLEVLYDLTESYLTLRNFERAKIYSRHQIAIEPWNEEAHRQLMLALTLSGRRSEALAQYDTCRQLLENELGVAPSLATRQLCEHIRGGDTSHYPALVGLLETQGSPRRMHNLPRALTSFIGREKEIAEVKQLLSAHPLVTLTGAGGVGKSRLALAIAAELVETLPDGAWLAELAAMDDPAHVDNAVARGLGLGSGQAQATVSGLCTYLYSRNILLVLDNCEHLLPACATLAQELLQSCPDLKILATSRENLGVPGECVYRVPSLDFPTLQSLSEPSHALEYAAPRLFNERARVIQPAFQLNESNLHPVATICQRLDGIPLAIELAAARLDVLTVEQLAARLDGSFNLLTSGGRTALPRHQTLRATIDWSYQLLSPKERLLLERLAVFAGGWTLEAAEAVCAGGEIAQADVLGLLTGLVSKSLVITENQDETESEPRFRLLEVVRQYAHEKLDQSGAEDCLRTRHLACFHKMARAAQPRLRDAERLIWKKKLDADRENLIRAMRWAVDERQDIPTGLDILFQLDRWMPLSGKTLVQTINWLRKGLAEWKDPEARLEPLRIEALCMLAIGESDRELGFSMISEALSLARQSNSSDRYPLALASFLYGITLHNQGGDSGVVLKCFDESMQIIEEIYPGSSHQKGMLYESTSRVLITLGRLDEAEKMARKSLEVMAAVGDRWYISPLIILGDIALKQENYAAARSYFEKAFMYGNGVEDNIVLHAINGLARVERVQNLYAEALAWHREAMRRSSQELFYHESILLFQAQAYTEIACSRVWPAQEAEDHLLTAARLLGAAEACRAVEERRIYVYQKPPDESLLAELRNRLDPVQLEQAWSEGLAMPIEQAASYALRY